MKQLVILSGKGGTGKTSVAASFATLAKNKVLADCDVDAADLHLILAPSPRRAESFSGSKVATVSGAACTACGNCADVCRFDAVVRSDALLAWRSPGQMTRSSYRVDPLACEGCGACGIVCPVGAIRLHDVVTGEWFVSDTRAGPMVHARLHAGQEASGKLVTIVRSSAAAVAQRAGLSLGIIDGPPGIGCPVIASLTGTDLALIVTEPTMSGLHDLDRVAGVAGKLGVPIVVAVNKCDLNDEMGGKIEDWCRRNDTPVVGRIPFDDDVTAAQMRGLSVTEHSSGPAATAIAELWERVEPMLRVD